MLAHDVTEARRARERYTHDSALELEGGFVVATGIECSAPRIADGVRIDELRKTGHWERYAEDLALVADFGIRYLRYGIPFHVVDRDPTNRDWAWTDAALDACRRAGIEPIADLMHFGVPDDLWGLGDESLPDRFARYADAFARRYPWVRWYTPVNEPLVGAIFSAGLGLWNERMRSDTAVVRAVDASAAAQALGMAAIRDRRPDAGFVLSDACESYVAEVPAVEPLAAFLNERRFVAWELALGRSPSAPVLGWLERHGMSDARLSWFVDHGTDTGCVIGLDYYRGNEWRVRADGRTAPARRRLGFARLAREYHDRLGLPFMLSETNIAGPLTDRWLAEIWDDALVLRAEGRPIRGICWYGFVDHVDWDSVLTRDRGIANPCGLVSLDREPHAWGLSYRRLAHEAQAGRLTPFGSAASRRYRREDAAAAALTASEPEAAA